MVDPSQERGFFGLKRIPLRLRLSSAFNQTSVINEQGGGDPELRGVLLTPKNPPLDLPVVQLGGGGGGGGGGGTQQNCI